jgi:hypothetical protein
MMVANKPFMLSVVILNVLYAECRDAGTNAIKNFMVVFYKCS